jgi:DNA-binding transcriptional LysR family regulator
VRRRLPSMEALMAFEAAARHESFTSAADELALTPSAVTRQIALLEEFVGVPLFNRVKKRVSLTDAGEAYAEQVRQHLNGLERDTLAAMSRQGSGGVLELAVIPTFATRWLIPRLPSFYALHPDVTLNLTTRAEPFLFTDTPFDAAIHFGHPVWSGAIAEPLFGEEMVPVCSPRLLGRAKRLDPAQFERFTLLHQSARPGAWRRWFGAAGVEEFGGMKGPRYELFSMLVEAARAGLGLALVPRFLVLQELKEGVLTIPCDISLRSEKGYYLVYPEKKQGFVLLQAFQAWLAAAAADYRSTVG